jgi:phytoene dehydrogenase-like protein
MNVIVIGADANELAAAHCLARAGHRVSVIDERATPPDWPSEGWVAPRIARGLGLERAGVRTRGADPWASAPLPGGGNLELSSDMARSVAAIGRLNARDAAKWPTFCERMQHLARLLEWLYLQPPPAPTGRSAGDLAQLAAIGLRIRRLGRRGVEDFLRIAPMSVADLLDDWFESDALKGILGAAGLTNVCLGPRSGGTALRLLHRQAGNPPGVFRAPVSNVREVLAGMPGITVRRGERVSRIAVREGRVAGVVLAGGEELPAAIVVSGADPKRTLLDLADATWIDPDLVRAVRNVRSRGVVARVTLALERPSAASALVLAPSLDFLERAYDDAKYGRVSAAPYLETRAGIPRADGRHEISVRVQYAPYALRDGKWDDARRAALANTVLRTLSRHAPGYEAAAVERVHSPRELENEHGWPEGQEEQAEPALDQSFWMRPVPELARYRTPIGGLYLCGTGMHPGGGIAGASGYNAAREVIRDLRRPRG